MRQTNRLRVFQLYNNSTGCRSFRRISSTTMDCDSCHRR